MKKHGFYENNADGNQYFNFHSATDNFIPAHYHGSTEMIFVKEGRVKVVVNGHEKLLTRGEIAVFHRFEIHYICGESGSDIYVLIFTDSFLPKNLQQQKLSNFLPTCPQTPSFFALLDWFDGVRKTATLAMQQSFVGLIVGALCNVYPTEAYEKTDAQGFVQILSFIENNYAEPLTLDSLAERFGYTRNYFSMLFNKYTGMHLRKYLNRMRVEHVIQMHKEHPDTAIGQIAISCGFNSLSTFYRAVKAMEDDK